MWMSTSFSDIYMCGLLWLCSQMFTARSPV